MFVISVCYFFWPNTSCCPCRPSINHYDIFDHLIYLLMPKLTFWNISITSAFKKNSRANFLDFPLTASRSFTITLNFTPLPPPSPLIAYFRLLRSWNIGTRHFRVFALSFQHSRTTTQIQIQTIMLICSIETTINLIK